MITIKYLCGVTHTISFAVKVSKKVRCIKKLMDNTQYGDCYILWNGGTGSSGTMSYFGFFFFFGQLHLFLSLTINVYLCYFKK